MGLTRYAVLHSFVETPGEFLYLLNSITFYFTASRGYFHSLTYGMSLPFFKANTVYSSTVTFFCYSQEIHCSLPYLPTQVSQSHTSKIHNVYFYIPWILSHSMILIMEEEADQEKRNWEKNLEAAINHLTAFNNFPFFWDLSFSLHNFCHYFYFFLVSISQLLLLHFNPSLKRIFFSAFLLKMDAINIVLTRGAGITVMNTSVYHTTNFFQNPTNEILKA